MSNFDLTKELNAIKARLAELDAMQGEDCRQNIEHEYLILQTSLRRLMKTVHSMVPQDKDPLIRENLDMIKLLSQQIALRCQPHSDEEILARRNIEL